MWAAVRPCARTFPRGHLQSAPASSATSRIGWRRKGRSDQSGLWAGSVEVRAQRRRQDMCGIVGYVGDEECAGLLVDGLRKLEYRGYDSAGVAVVGKEGLSVVRAKGKLANLEKRLSEQVPSGMTGIGHTRWATHGKPSDENAHPHKYGGVAVVHNGILENHLELKESLARAGHKFASETDT